MKYLQVVDPWLRRALAEWAAQEKKPSFEITEAAASVSIALDGDAFVLRVLSHEADRYELPVRLPALVADIVWLFARRSEEAQKSLELTGGFTLEPHRFSLRHGTSEVALTGREVALLQFMANTGECSKETLLRDVWRYHPETSTHTIETHLWRLRQKLQHAGVTAPLIVTTENGYRLA